MLRVLPDPTKIAEIRQLASYGWTAEEVSEKVFPDDPGKHGFQAVRLILADDTDRFDPVVDEIAVERALRGDRAAWDSLTHYERREFMLRIHARRGAEVAENEGDRAGFPGEQWSKNRGWQYKAPNDKTPEWMDHLAGMLGFGRAARLTQEAKAFAEARVL